MIMNRVEILKSVEAKHLKTGLPEFHVGDTVKMRIKVIEAEKVRVHPFEGIVIRKNSGRIGGSFTVRKISFGEGVERIFPLHSPVIESLQVVSRGRVNKSKLYYLRDRLGKKSRVRQQQQQQPQSQPQPQT